MEQRVVDILLIDVDNSYLRCFFNKLFCFCRRDWYQLRVVNLQQEGRPSREEMCVEIQGRANLKDVIDQLLTAAVTDGVTPGAVAGVAVVSKKSERKSCICSSGFTTRERTRTEVTAKTVYDLASLTKPLVTVLCTLHLVERKVLTLDMVLSDLLPFSTVPDDKKNIQLRQLLGHCSGFPAHRPYFIEALAVKKGGRKDFFLQSILDEPLEYSPGKMVIYSDLGFILLGYIIEQKTGKSLEQFHRKNILEPLGLQNHFWFTPSVEKRNIDHCAATEICPWTEKPLCGVVHDDNCRVMGGVAGHAGLFGTVEGVLQMGQFMVEVWNGWRTTELFSRELLKLFLTRFPGSTWTCGFDTPSAENSSSGRYFGPASIGHLGFTGCSIWIDLARGCVVVLLTNRVNPSRKNIRIRQFRPLYHDAVMKHLCL